MREEIFNPDIIEDKPDEDQNNSKQDNETNNKSRKSILKKISSFILNGRLLMLVGTIISLFGVYLLICLISFFKTGAVDQSSIIEATSIENAQGANHIDNLAGALGASISDSLINQGIGLSSFIFALWIIVFGLTITKLFKVKLFSFTLVCTILIIVSALVLGLLSLDSDTFFLYGGNYGRYSSLFLIKWVGYPGTILIYFILLFSLFLLWYKSIKMAYVKAKSFIPKHKISTEDGITTIEVENDITNNKSNGNGDSISDVENDDTNIAPLKIEKKAVESINIEEIPLTNDISNKPQKEPKKEKVVEGDIPMIIKTGTIEKADKVSSQNEVIDPTQELSRYKFPTLDLLKKFDQKDRTIDVEEQEENKRKITETLNNYGIPIKTIEVCVGPTVTLFEIIPADGVRISKIKNLEDDIALSLSALGIRIIAPIPGRGTIGIEVPNRDPQIVSMRSILESKKYQECKYELPMAMGCTISNEVYIADLCKMPHMLVAGATGQGKSVGLNAIITSLIYRKHPAELKFVLIDPKMVEFSLYSKLEHHYLAKLPEEEEAIITDPSKVIATLNSLAIEMDNRYSLLKDAQVRNIKEYNAKYVNRTLNPEKGHKYLPYIVVIVDEFCDLIMMAGKEVEMPIARIAQKARAVGMHMIIATQRPSTNVITGIIKANFPGRIAFRVTQMVDSRTILDCSGAQQLIGRGDMLFLANGDMERVQCAFIDTPEVAAVCDFIDKQVGYEEAYVLPEYIAENDKNGSSDLGLSDRDSLFEDAAEFIVTAQTASTSSLQRRYAIGYNRAGKIMDQMQAAGIVGPSQGGKPRQVLIDSIQLTQMLNK